MNEREVVYLKPRTAIERALLLVEVLLRPLLLPVCMVRGHDSIKGTDDGEPFRLCLRCWRRDKL